MVSEEKTQRASLLLSLKLQQNLGKDPRIIILVPQKMGIFKLLNCISWLIIPTVQLYTGNCLLQLPGCCRSVVPLHQRAQSLNPKAVVKILLGVLKAASFHVPFDNVLDVAGMILFAVLRTGRSLNGCPVMWSRRWCCHE